MIFYEIRFPVKSTVKFLKNKKTGDLHSLLFAIPLLPKMS